MHSKHRKGRGASGSDSEPWPKARCLHESFGCPKILAESRSSPAPRAISRFGEALKVCDSDSDNDHSKTDIHITVARHASGSLRHQVLH